MLLKADTHRDRYSQEHTIKNRYHQGKWTIRDGLCEYLFLTVHPYEYLLLTVCPCEYLLLTVCWCEYLLLIVRPCEYLLLTACWCEYLFSTVRPCEYLFSTVGPCSCLVPMSHLLANHAVSSRFNLTSREALFSPDHSTRTLQCTQIQNQSAQHNMCKYNATHGASWQLSAERNFMAVGLVVEL